ncbi:MAG: polymerase delta subunit [Hyphomicrobiales bacterium]|nr:polymerase delta subunit [Hyphomicrobiales bacterium]
MVAIRHWEAENFLAKPPGHVAFYLFYGTDTGLVSERARLIVKSSIDSLEDAFQLVRMEGDDLAGESGRLADEVNTIGLFGGRRAIWVKAGARNLVPAFEAVMDTTPKDAVVVVEAGALKKDSGLRKIFERSRHAAAIECAHDTPEQLRQIIETQAKAAGLAIDRETADLLSHSLGADRLTTRAELDKLLLYKHGLDRIEEADIGAIVADASALSLDAAMNAAFSGRLDLVDEAVQQAFIAGTDPGMLLGMAGRHAVMLHRAKLDAARGIPQEAALEKASRRAFNFTRKDVLARQFGLWTADGLARAVEIFGRAIQECRYNARLAETLATRAFWSVASAARRGAR